MKKIIPFILFVAAVVSFGLYQNLKINSNINIVKDSFTQKIENRKISAIGFYKWRQKLLTNEETGKVDASDYNKAVAEVKALTIKTNKADMLSLDWISRGPDNQGGRTRSLLIDKDDENLIFTGSVSGGLYKSIDAGDDWQRVSSYNNTNNTGIMCLAQGVNRTIFVGTGEDLGGSPDDFNSPADSENTFFAGSGIYYSRDLGDTWVSIDVTNPNSSPSYTDDWKGVRKMATHPNESNILMAATKTGLFYSNNADITQPTFTEISGITVGATGVTDVVISADGKDAWCASGGKIFKSSTNSFNDPWTLVNPSVTASRAQIAISSIFNTDDYFIYASFTNTAGCLAGIYKSEDKGETWIEIVDAGGQDPFIQPTGGGCQGGYDHCIAVNPADKDKIYIGGITFYTWSSGSGGLKRADKIDSEGATHFDPDYIHADKHGIFFNQHDASGNTMFIVGDGGIARTLNANSGFPDEMIYTENNRNYITLQCYSVGTGKYGEIMAGAQDNGTQYVTCGGISELTSKEISGGDGVAGAEISNFNPKILFTGSQNGRIMRSVDGISAGSFVDENIDRAGCGKITCTPLSIPTGEICDDREDEGRFIYPFLLMETHARKVPRQNAFIYARDEIITLPGGTIAEIKDTIFPGNVVNHPNFKFQYIPNLHTDGLDLTFNITSTIMPGDTVFFETGFDAKYFVPTHNLCNNEFFVCTNPLQVGTQARFSSIILPGQHSIQRMDYSSDGDMIVAASGGRVIIMQGWDAYDPDTNPNSVIITSLNLGGIVSGISVDKNDPTNNRVLVTKAGYGGTSKVFIIENAASSSPIATSAQGDLPIMPTYACVISFSDNNKYIVGTELGIFATDDAGASWYPANDGIDAIMPVFAVREKWVNEFDCYLLSAGTVGGGMFTSTSLSSCAVNFCAPNSIDKVDIEVKATEILVYPNPVQDNVNVAFDLIKNSNVSVSIIDLTGRVVSSNNYKLPKGKQTVSINVSSLAKSNYVVEVKTNNTKYNSKIFSKK